MGGVTLLPPRPDGGGSDDALFVYGTLLPGHLRWRMLEPHQSSHGHARSCGQLYDTGNGWPAAVFDAPGIAAGRPAVRGAIVRFPAGSLASLLPALDEMEGIGPVPDGRIDPYVRRKVLVTTFVGGPGPDQYLEWAWAYHATSVGASWRPIDEWVDQAEA
jgi:gamma-glutamylcyclotransferase (GGCT)/AIG2-like uncharacterized protein YtfP